MIDPRERLVRCNAAAAELSHNRAEGLWPPERLAKIGVPK
jgi:hypothetical protein